MLVNILVRKGALQSSLIKGDVPNLCEAAVTLSSAATAVTLTAADIATGILKRTGSPGGAVADTWPSAEAIINALAGNLNKVAGMTLAGDATFQRLEQFPHLAQQILEQGASMRILITNATGQTITETAPSSAGVTISGTATIATGSWAEYLIQCNNTAKPQASNGTLTNGAATCTGVDSTVIKRIFPGMSVYGTNVPAGTTVLAVSQDAASLTLSANATGSGVSALTFTPTVVIERLRGGTN